jgi:hypothetical protein
MLSMNPSKLLPELLPATKERSAVKFKLPLTARSPSHLHVLQNAILISLSVFLAPLCISIAVLSRIVSPYTKVAKHIKHHRKWRATSSTTFRPRTVLVTGIGMSKGLAIARAFYRAGHNVIGADFEPFSVPVSGRFSTAIKKFYRLTAPDGEENEAVYTRELKDIVEKESVDLWVPCSGVAYSIEDADTAEVIEKETSCKVIQFGVTLTETLHHKDSFIDNTRLVGLNVPDTHLVTSETEALAVLYPEKPRAPLGARFIMKSVALDDSTRADMTLLPRPTIGETESHIKRLNPTPFRPFVLQQYISGPEYCTHSLIIRGKVQAFVACPSAELLMHYNALPASSALSQAMLLYTSIYAKKTGTGMTGHFSLDFLVDESVALRAEKKVGVEQSEVRELMDKIYPIECNPRAHTAVVLFADESEDLAEAYLSVLPGHEPKGISNGHRAEALIVPQPSVPGYYWVGHDLVSRVLLPLLAVLRFEMGFLHMLGLWVEFLEHVLYWRDGTYEIWDPLPALWLYVGYWPCMFVLSLWTRRWWSRCSVSTTKMFEC